jgi:predicted metal-binding membrane protein
VNRSAGEDETGRRIGLFCVGGSVAALSAFVALGVFSVATMMMNPALEGSEYWAEVGTRLAGDAALSVTMVAAGFVACLGVAVMIRAALGPRRGMLRER